MTTRDRNILGAKRIALIAPYERPLIDWVVNYIEHAGIKVCDALCIEIPDNLEVGQCDPRLLVDGVNRLNTVNVDAVALSACVQMQSLPAIQSVEDRLGIPRHRHIGMYGARDSRPRRGRGACAERRHSALRKVSSGSLRSACKNIQETT